MTIQPRGPPAPSREAVVLPANDRPDAAPHSPRSRRHTSGTYVLPGVLAFVCIKVEPVFWGANGFHWPISEIPSVCLGPPAHLRVAYVCALPGAQTDR